MFSVHINNQKVLLDLKRSKRARRIRLQIDQTRTLKVVVPSLTPNFMVKKFVESQEVWIEKHLKIIAAEDAEHAKPSYSAGESFFLLGEKLELVFKPNRLKMARVRIFEDELQVITQDQSVVKVKNAVEKFYKKKAEEVIYDRLEFFNEYYGFKFNKVTMKNQKSRWGSCSSARNLNFNWRLVMAPIEVIDYVVVHELSHLKHMNHSKAFWFKVSEQIPEYKSYKKWLKDFSYLLRI